MINSISNSRYCVVFASPVYTARERPRVGVLYVYGRSIKNCFHIQFGHIRHYEQRHSKDRINIVITLKNAIN